MPLIEQTPWVPAPQRIAAVLWITFLMAALATGVFFSTIDPVELKYCLHFPEVSRMAAYTIGFFLFWLLTASSALLAVFFVYPSNAKSASVDELPPRNRLG
ncbi:MAG: hypothetical protein HYX63_12875 [Gammaproteobacteria bacterium]|nr:hypothetical protein [Gammaproteobacteria bacterium]